LPGDDPRPLRRWSLCWLLFAATALSFLDRQVLSVLAPTITREFSLSNESYSRILFAFQASYTVMFALGGRLVDVLGTRIGMAACIGVWSLASAAHSLVRNGMMLGAARFLLGVGEGGCFPAATKGAAEWFPAEGRALAMGVATGGSALGAVIAPPLVAWAADKLGWRTAFQITGLLGALWLAAWMAMAPKRTEQAAAAPRIPVREWLSRSSVWWILGARFLFDPVFYFYMFWIPQYLSRERHMSVAQIGSSFWIPFLVLGISQVLGGRVSDLLVKQGWEPVRARQAVLGAAAFLTPASWLAAVVSQAEWAIALMCVLMFAHGFWITNFLGLLGDVYPREAIATITGLTGTAGGIGGMLSSLAIGAAVDRFSFTPVFAISGILYPLAFAAILIATARSRNAATRPLREEIPSRSH
jgi:ACS family hexuronate transporter-like MFS transporter